MNWVNILLVSVTISFLVKRLVVDSRALEELRFHSELGSCKRVFGAVGVEDIVITKNGIAFLSSLDKRAILHGEVTEPGAGVYIADLNSEDILPVKAEVVGFDAPVNPHGIGLFEDGTDVFLFVVNHRRIPNDINDTIEIFQYKDDKLFHQETVRSPLFKSLNDVVPTSKNSFYCTNDHYLNNHHNLLHVVLEDTLGVCLADVVHYKNGVARMAAFRLCYANGIALGSDNRLYVSETLGDNVDIFKIKEDGSLSLLNKIPLKTSPDNIHVVETPSGNQELYIASVPKSMSFLAHAVNKENPAPTQIVVVTVDRQSNATINEIFCSDGTDLSAASIAAVYKSRIVAGPVFDDHILVCDRNKR